MRFAELTLSHVFPGQFMADRGQLLIPRHGSSLATFLKVGVDGKPDQEQGNNARGGR